MEITINDHRKIFGIQEEFSSLFPNLKLEFFEKPHTSGGAHATHFVKHNSKTVEECRTTHNAGKIIITPGMTVVDMERNFSDVYGLKVQTYRKTDNEWLKIDTNERLSLEEENNKGSIIKKEEKD
jgi:hypothetical protein